MVREADPTIIVATRAVCSWLASPDEEQDARWMEGTSLNRMTSDAQARSGRSISLGVFSAVLASIVLRGAMLGHGTGQFDDPDNYLPLARSVAEGRGLALDGRLTAYRPPLYPLILAPLFLLEGQHAFVVAGLLHLALGAGTVALTAAATNRFGYGRRRATAAAWIVACDPVLAWQCRFIMTETLTAFLIAGALFALALPRWRGSTLGGAILGLASLSRPSILPGAFLVILAALLVRREPLRQRARHSLLIALALLLVLTPWAVRNALVFGEPVWTTTHGGYTLALANNEVYYRDVLNGPAGRVWTGADQWLWWDSVNRAAAGMPEPQADRFLRDRALELALREPVDFTRATLQRLARFWSIAPAMAVYKPFVRYTTAAWTLPLWIALGLGLCRSPSWRWPQITAPLMLVGLTLVHAFYWTDLRMRAPVVPAIAVLAASATLPGWMRRRRPWAAGAT
jgi:4-amino-4-deoxy-L-arabinose transferase-like glycosyltransferase